MAHIGKAEIDVKFSPEIEGKRSCRPNGRRRENDNKRDFQEILSEAVNSISPPVSQNTKKVLASSVVISLSKTTLLLFINFLFSLSFNISFSS